MSDRKAEGQQKVVSAAEFAAGWDLERRHQELGPPEMTVSGTTAYVPARLKMEMDKNHKAPVTHVKTKTVVKAGKVWFAPCEKGEPGARLLRNSKTYGSAAFGFSIPLRKMGVRLPEGRQLKFKVHILPVEGGGMVYEISFAEAVNEPGVGNQLQARAKLDMARSVQEAAAGTV